MKKTYTRLFALLICAVMVIGMIPVNANAAITYNPNWGAHFFTEYKDLVEIAAAAANDPDNWYQAYYEGEEVITFTSNLTLPDNLYVGIWGDVEIPAGVTADLHATLSCENLTVKGTVNVGTFSDDNNWENDVWGGLRVSGNLTITGAVNVNCGTLSFDADSSVTGFENIHRSKRSTIQVENYVGNEAKLLEVIARANADVYGLEYHIYVMESLNLSNPVTIPQNATLLVNYPDIVLTGAPITVYGGINVGAYESDTVIENDLIIAQAGLADFYNNNGYRVILKGNVTNYSELYIGGTVVVNGVLDNHAWIYIDYQYDGRLHFAAADLYKDHLDEESAIYLYHNATYFPEDAIVGLNLDDFQHNINDPQSWNNLWVLSGYQYSGGTPQPPAHEHTVVNTLAVAPTCLDYGCTAGATCSECGEVLVVSEQLAPLGHDYGLDQAGQPDFYDPDCDVCGAVRVINPERLTHSMYRMFNPNSGEHFYTGSMAERQTLEAAGWKYEGVGFTFPASAGDPVYRLFEPITGEHLYTMDENEKAALLAAGWSYEGIAFNSDAEKEVPQYRLYNPNVTVGAYHFTASVEERDSLLAAGWIDQGIGFYTCLQ